eukprot:TRINITY_DN116325_c0_g1_i1.p1 TRINITY_DN116325_c0_g1~~TRINITY_DN116325_c0_g1_i1.p1  ORF type:complete len:179 (-),score=22.53 TRINITY_DN116325_c0_g1_i1:33-536(-)
MGGMQCTGCCSAKLQSQRSPDGCQTFDARRFLECHGPEQESARQDALEDTQEEQHAEKNSGGTMSGADNRTQILSEDSCVSKMPSSPSVLKTPRSQSGRTDRNGTPLKKTNTGSANRLPHSVSWKDEESGNREDIEQVRAYVVGESVLTLDSEHPKVAQKTSCCPFR